MTLFSTTAAPHDPYAILGVDPSASPAAVRAAYAAAALANHPDKGGDAAAFVGVQRAYEVLRDETQRRELDAQRSAGASQLRRRAPPAAEDVDVDDFLPTSPSSEGARAYPCRCGGAYVLSRADARAAVDLLPCSSCSLFVRVITAAPSGALSEGCADNSVR